MCSILFIVFQMTFQCSLVGCAIPKEILLNLVDDENQTPLHWAINNGDVETVELLMNNGTSLDAQMV